MGLKPGQWLQTSLLSTPPVTLRPASFLNSNDIFLNKENDNYDHFIRKGTYTVCSIIFVALNLVHIFYVFVYGSALFFFNSSIVFQSVNCQIVIRTLMILDSVHVCNVMHNCILNCLKRNKPMLG